MSYIYLDEAATTRVDERVKEAMDIFFTDKYGNPSSLHKKGREAGEAMEEARKRTADLIGADKEEIIFTSGGTEADNLAIEGALRHLDDEKDHIITTQIEHPAVFNTCRYLEGNGYEVTYLPVDEEGLVDPQDFECAIKESTALASIMYANNEIGTVEPIEELAAIARKKDVLFHTDAVQAVGKIPLDVKEEKIDLLSLSAHKLHGPKGVGALYKDKDVEIEPLQHGGGHEEGLRSGTENVPGIVGLGKACEIAQEEMDDYLPKMEELRNELVGGVLESIPASYLNGHYEKRLPHNANFYFEGIEGEAIVLKLDTKGIAASTGSACSSQDIEGSRILVAIGNEKHANSSLRLTLSRYTEEEEINEVLDVLPDMIKKLREMSPLWEGK